jgi:cytosine deaminase
MLGRAMMIGYRSGFNTDEDLALAFDIVTAGGAKALRLDDHGLRVGAKADFVAIDAPHVPQAVVDLPRRRMVYKNGRLVAREGVIVPKRLNHRPDALGLRRTICWHARDLGDDNA